MQDNILITGSSGFVGANLIPYLSNHNYNVIGISRKPNEKEISYSDLDAGVWNSSNAFIHLAGKAHDLKKVASDKDYYDVNRDLTINLFHQFLISTCSVFIYVSSVKAAKDSIDETLTEEHTPDPVTVYGKSKLEAEKYLLSKEIPIGKKVYIVRPCMIHGPFNKGNLNLLYTFVSKRIPYPLGKFSNLRSFVSIDNFCFLLEKLLKTKINSGVYNIADDEPLSTKDLVTLIGDEISKPAMVLNIPKGFIYMIAKIGDVIRLPINTERIDKLTENYVVSNAKIKKALALKELPLSSELGMMKTINSFNKK
jgi:nucleoside-diphosphate-sugar epimerase